MDDKKFIILFNDYDPVLARVARLKFQKEAGWTVEITSNYDEAMKSIKDTKPQLILTELMLQGSGGQTGFDLIEDVRKIENYHDIPIAVLTELAQDEDKNKAIDLGANYYFIKSQISITNLIEELKSIVNS